MDSRQQQVKALYQQLLDAWNHKDARAMADLYTEDGEQIGFDGSQVFGQAEIYAHIAPIFEQHETARFVGKVKSVLFLSQDIAILRAIAGMVAPGQSDLNPKLNAHQTMISIRAEETWRIVLFQNTPAQFHGRPELVEQMSAELRQQLV
ncbi:SgcJ/EcaC family oxidoreductase [Alicyclobacillus tolerans]|uniref:SgcJ/EcaC family oxidoreductase n=1 Tax=Alicyclobacillus tolerans TaxID=90970 RepID=UPI001F41D4DF|nr:SgcJ/EcaC family oxidoreductase [Alicyclobacillus tolerans]MCF8564585.1 SgcJ/EcaC family oxidoreductase [Alicyclobacillus tolerans]